VSFAKTVQPKQVFRGTILTPVYALDMRVSDKIGAELKDEIMASVIATQNIIMRELPSILIVSHKQFISLNEYTEEMYQTTDRLFATPLNVMEVEVDEELDHQELLPDTFGDDWDSEGLIITNG